MLNLTSLQNKTKRSPSSYAAEFRQQLRSYDAQRSIFELSPPQNSKEFGQLVTFLSHVSELYPEDSAQFGPSVQSLLEKNYEAMDPELRRTLFQALVLLRNKNCGVDCVGLITLCFGLFRCRDKQLRELIYSHIVNDVRNVNRKATDMRLNKAIQNVVYRMLEDPSTIAAKKSLQVMVDLYKRRVWLDQRTVNVIAQACVSSHPKLVAIALQFFLGIDEKIDALMDEEDEELADEALQAATGKSKEKLAMGEKKGHKIISKKTRSNLRRTEKVKKELRKARIAKGETSESKRQNSPRFPAIELLNDPQGFAEKLLKKAKASNDHFDLRMMMMNLTSRVVGYHKLILLPLYSFLQKYLQPHQKNVTAILAYLIQSAHELVPPEDLEPVVKHIANNFVSDRSGSEVMAVGLNSVRHLFVKVPLLTAGEGADDLIQDLVQYKNYRRDKSVVIAARGLLNTMRELNPAALARKERGKFHSTAKLREYGEADVADGVDGAELLQLLEEEAAEIAKAEGKSRLDSDEEEDDDDDEERGEMEVESGDEEEEEDEGDDDQDEEDDAEEDGEDEGEEDQDGEEERDEDDDEEKRPSNGRDHEAVDPDETLLEKSLKRKPIPQTNRIDAQRLLTDEDFARIRKLKAKLEKEKMDPRARRKNEKVRVAKHLRTKNALLEKLMKQGFTVDGAGEQAAQEDPFESDNSSSEQGSDSDESMGDGFVNPDDLQGVVRKRRKELRDRLAKVHEGRAGAHALSKRRTGGTNNQEKEKGKVFQMVKEKREIKQKARLSVRQQQMQLKAHMKHMLKNAKTVQKVRRRSGKVRT